MSDISIPIPILVPVEERIGNFFFQVWDSNKTGERTRHNLFEYTFNCDVCKRRIPYESENMYGVQGHGKYLCYNEKCKVTYILQNI